MNDGRGDEVLGSSPLREAPLDEEYRSRKKIYGSEQDQSKYRSREEIKRVGPRQARFAEDLEDREDATAGERLSEGSRGEIGREAFGGDHTGNDHVENDDVENDHGPLYNVPLDHDNRQPKETLRASPRRKLRTMLRAPPPRVSSSHEQPSTQRSAEHVEPRGPLPFFTSGPRRPKSFRSRVSTRFKRFFQTRISFIKRRFDAHPIITSISLFLILLALILFIYLLSLFIPWVVRLLKLKSYIDSQLAKLDEWKGKIDEFKDQVVGKFSDWLGDGKALADNVKDKVKEKVNGGIDKVNDVVKKIGVKVGYVDRRGVIGPAGVVGVAGRAVGRRGWLDNLGPLWNVVRNDEVATTVVTSEVTTTTATVWEPSSISSSGTVVRVTEMNGATVRRGNILLPFVLLGSLAGLARGEEHFPKVSDATSTTLLESQITPTLATATISNGYTSTSTTTPDLQHTRTEVREPKGGGGGKKGNQNKDKTPQSGHNNNQSSFALGHRDYLPYPILIFGNMLRYARAEIVNPCEKFPPASTTALSLTTTVVDSVRPTTFEECMLAQSLEEFQDCCRLIEDPIQLNVCIIQQHMDPHFPVTTTKPVKRFTNEEADSRERPQGFEENCVKEAGTGRVVCDKHRRGEPWGRESSIEQTRHGVHPGTGTIILASTTTVIHEVTKRDEPSEIGASGGAKSVLGESLVFSTVSTTSTAVASAGEERIEPTSTETANLTVRRFGGLS